MDPPTLIRKSWWSFPEYREICEERKTFEKTSEQIYISGKLEPSNGVGENGVDPRPPTVLRMWRRSTEETALHMATGEGGQRPPMFNPRTARRKDRSCGLIHEKYWIHCIVLRPPYSSNKVSPVLRYCATGVESPDMADMGQKQCPHTYFTLTHCTDHFREPLNVLKHASAHSTPLRHSRVTFKPEKTPRGKPEASIPASRTTHLRHRLHGKGVKNPVSYTHLTLPTIYSV